MCTQNRNPVLPNSFNDSQCQLVRTQEKKIEDLTKDSQRLESENKLLRERIHKLVHQLYGGKSEKLPLNETFEQPGLFENDEEEAAPEVEVVTVPEHKRKKGGRKPLPASLERIEMVHDIAESEKECGCGHKKSCIGQEVSEKLEMLPAYFWVLRYIRLKYACKECEGVDKEEGSPSVKIAPVAPTLLPRSIATPSLLAHVLVGKFCDSLPFYRQEKQFHRLGFDLSRNRMCSWAIKVAQRCKPLVQLLRQEILSGPLINMDETKTQVLNEPDRKVRTNSFMWVSRGGLPEKPVVIYHYDESRSSSVARELLKGYHGCVQTDGYGAYDFLDDDKNIIHAGCWTHVRRKYLDVLKAGGLKSTKKIKNNPKGLGKAGEVLQIIGELYAIEKKAREQNLSPQQLQQERQANAKPILDKLEIWLKELVPTVAPKSYLGKALNYTLGQWPRLIKYLDNGIISIDNNWAENAIRPFVVGRKNWLFFDQPAGAEAGAIMYSLIETAKENGLEPYDYLLFLFDKLPLIDQEDLPQLKALLPINIDTHLLRQYKKQYFEKFEK